jgi:hypothetical protein
MDLTFEQTQCKSFDILNFEFLMQSNKNKQKTKVATVHHLMDEHDFRLFVDDHKEIHVKKEDLEELHGKNEKKHAD